MQKISQLLTAKALRKEEKKCQENLKRQETKFKPLEESLDMKEKEKKLREKTEAVM